jgi:hypothetical protein
MLPRILRGDPTIPAGRVRPSHSVVLADRAAAAQVYEKLVTEAA